MSLVVESTGAPSDAYTGTITLAPPAGITDGDILVAVIYQQFGDATFAVTGTAATASSTGGPVGAVDGVRQIGCDWL